MSVFVCCVAKPRGVIAPRLATDFDNRLTRLGLATGQWQRDEGLLIGFTATNGKTDDLVARTQRATAVGIVHLNNRAELKRVVGPIADDATDLHIALETVCRFGARAPRMMIGDFAFATWDRSTRRLLAYRDPLGVEALYYRQIGDHLILSNDSGTLALEDEIDAASVAEYLTNGSLGPDQTIHAHVSTVGPGRVLEDTGSGPLLQQYWRIEDFQEQKAIEAADAIGEFRRLFIEAVHLGLGDARCWAQLSGGLDSSSVVSTIEATARIERDTPRLLGTITYVDELGAGYELDYAREVASRFGLANEVVCDWWLWQDDGAAPPIASEPYPFYPFYARERRVAALLKAAGCDVLFSGAGADQYLGYNRIFLADWAWRGQFNRTLRYVTEWAIAREVSFWKLMKRHVVRPLLPRSLYRGAKRVRRQLPSFIRPQFARQHEMHNRLMEVRRMTAPRGQQFTHSRRLELESIGAQLVRTPYEDAVSLRFPFLYRPLVEFSLGLPPEFLMQPAAHKWILREAMGGILPERIRERTSKGTIGQRLRWSFGQEMERLNQLTRVLWLEEIGAVDGKRLRETLKTATNASFRKLNPLLDVLSLEFWHRVRTDNWSDGSREGDLHGCQTALASAAPAI